MSSSSGTARSKAFARTWAGRRSWLSPAKARAPSEHDDGRPRRPAVVYRDVHGGTCMPNVRELSTVRYQVTDIERAIRFYTEQLGFTLEDRAGSAFAAVTRGALRLILSGPG